MEVQGTATIPLSQKMKIFSMKVFKQVFTHGKQFDKAQEKIATGFYVNGRLFHHMLTYIVVPSKGHKDSIIFMRMVLIQALHEGKKMNFDTFPWSTFYRRPRKLKKFYLMDACL